VKAEKPERVSIVLIKTNQKNLQNEKQCSRLVRNAG
jgi:hypothetical protein